MVMEIGKWKLVIRKWKLVIISLKMENGF